MEEHELREESLREYEEDASGGNESTESGGDKPSDELREINDRYLRLYAEFENYRKRMQRDKEELVKYGNENLLYDLLPVLDNLEMALKHSALEASTGIVQGVEITLKEFQRTLEKFGLLAIESAEKPFDPAKHHAMSHVERTDVEGNMVVEEFRKGYMFRDKVLRPSLVAVSKMPLTEQEQNQDEY